MSVAIRSLMVVMALRSLTSALAAQDTDRLVGALTARIPQLMEAEHVPGLSMVLIRENQIAWKGTFGVRSAGGPEPVNAETVFEAASMSKPLYSYAVLKLAEEGRFDLDLPLDRYLAKPYLPDQPLARKITGRMVMLHRTGLPNWREGGWRKGGPLPVLHEPGTRFTYSGEGYAYLQSAINELTGQSMSAWMERALLKPLNMTRSSYEWKGSFENNHAGGHDKDGTLKKPRRFYQKGNSAYSLYTTPTDYALFLIELMKRDRSAPQSLNAEFLRGMTTLQVEPEKNDERSRRSLGWVVASEEDGGWIRHSGSNGSGFQCNARFNMEHKSGCVIMANSDRGRRVWEAVLMLIDSKPWIDRQEARQPTGDTWGSARRTIRYECRVMNPTTNDAGKIDVLVPLPLASPRQEIHYLHLPKRGLERRFTDEHGQELAHYSFDQLAAGEWIDLGFVVGVSLSNMRWNPNGDPNDRDPPELTPAQRERYLKSEKNYSMEDQLMRNAAAELTRDATSDFDKLARIHDYIISKVRYVMDGKWDPAATVLTRGSGSCSEYNYVLSGLCRLAGLPTRCVGGSTSGHRQPPTSDTVFHRWTEIFLSGYGWIPVDCSRDANPIRGKRSHFGRVYSDALVWCQQAGGDGDTLGWEYRAKARIKGDSPGVKTKHRTRWFDFYPEEDIEAAYAWFSGETDLLPEPDLLECAALHWGESSPDDRLKLIRAMAASGRNACLRLAVGLPEAGKLRETCVRELCDSPELADTILEKSRNTYQFHSWFRKNDSNWVAAPEGRFRLNAPAPKQAVTVTTDSPSKIWADLSADLADQLAEPGTNGPGTIVAIMPVEDRTMAGLGDKNAVIHSDLKKQLARRLDIQLIDETRFTRLMESRGPGRGEYWLLANGEHGSMPPAMIPELILVPICTSKQSDRKKDHVLFRFDLKRLDLATCRYTTIVSSKRRLEERVRK